MSKLSQLTDELLSEKTTTQNNEPLPRLFDLNKSMGTKTTTPQITETNINPLNIAKDIFQGTARSGGSLGISLLGKETFNKTEDMSKFEKLTYKLLFGEEPLESIGKRVEKFPERAKEFGIPEIVSKPTAPFVIGALTALDFTGLGGEKNVYKALAKTDDILEASKIARTIGVSEDLVLPFAQKIVKITDETEIKKAVEQFEQTMRTTKTVSEIPEELKPLAEEARKHKSAEEFVKAQGKPVYHATTKDFSEFQLPKTRGGSGEAKAVFFSDTAEGTKYYQRQGGKIMEANISPDAKIFNYKKDISIIDEYVNKLDNYNPSQKESAKRLLTSGNWGSIESEKFQSFLKSKGYDGFRVMDMTGNEAIGITNVSKIKTKSQLTDIWNKANAGSKVDPLIAEAKKYKSAEDIPIGAFEKDITDLSTFTSPNKKRIRYSYTEGNLQLNILRDTNRKYYPVGRNLRTGEQTPFFKTDKSVMGGKTGFDIFEEAKSQLIDFYNKAVKEVKPTTEQIKPLKGKSEVFTEPKLKTKISNIVADEAIKFAKKNPESSLVAKEFRNPKTKELIAPPRLFKRIGEAIKNGEINIESLPEMVKKYGLNNEETAQLFEDAASYSGRTLQALSRVEKEIRALLPDIVFPKRELTLWEKFKVKYLAVDNFRRSLLVTQLATAARNAISQTGRYSLETLNDGLAGAISKLTGKGEGFTPFFEDIAAIFRKTNKKNFQELENLLKKNPLENARLYNTPVGDVALSNKVSNALNILNRGQEFFFRNLILDAKLHTAAKIKGVEIIKLSAEDIAKAVDDALDWTFAKSPARGSFGAGIMSMYRAMPPLTLINPFPRFMSNAIKFLYEYSPMGIMSLFSGKTRAAIAAGDYRTISKAIIGTSMLGAAVAIRANQNLAGEKWYEIKVGDKRIDLRPFAPFSTYLFFAEIMANGTEKISGSDWAQAAIGINRVAGTGLALIDLIGQKVDTKNAKNVIMPIINQYIGGFTVPFITIKDIIGNFKLEERTIKETKEIPFIGAAMGNIPGLNELLPTKYSMFEDKPLEREKGLLRQTTGITIKTKSFIEKELDRMGKDIGDIIPKTGNLEANRIISKQTGILLDKFNDKIRMSEKYQNIGDDEKLKLLQDLISEAKKEAKGEIASDLAGVVYNEIKKSKSDKRKETIKNLKNRGLITENILDYLLPMLEAEPLPR